MTSPTFDVSTRINPLLFFFKDLSPPSTLKIHDDEKGLCVLISSLFYCWSKCCNHSIGSSSSSSVDSISNLKSILPYYNVLDNQNVCIDLPNLGHVPGVHRESTSLSQLVSIHEGFGRSICCCQSSCSKRIMGQRKSVSVSIGCRHRQDIGC